MSVALLPANLHQSQGPHIDRRRCFRCRHQPTFGGRQKESVFAVRINFLLVDMGSIHPDLSEAIAIYLSTYTFI